MGGERVRERSKLSGSENRKSRISYLVENKRDVLFTGRMATVSIICGLRRSRWFFAGFSYTHCTKMQQVE